MVSPKHATRGPVMRHNLPITQREYDYPAHATLLSTTDQRGRITYANAAFMSVSGYERDEILGQPHNTVRHPDMPPEAFEDMWATLKAGKSWTALVKNRRKDGDHYWVRANATPVMHQGQITGFMSVRTRPTREEVTQAETLYSDFREGRSGKLRFHQGLIVRTGWGRWRSALQTMPVRWRLRLALGTVALSIIAVSYPLGVNGQDWAILTAWSGITWALVAAWLDAQITRPLALVQQQAASVAAGQAGHNEHLNRIDEIGMILRAVNQSGLNLRSLIDDVGEQVAGLRSASQHIAQGNSALSVRTEQTASSLQETAASMEQMTASVHHSADTAQQASELAITASDAARQGGQVVAQVVGTMQAITTSSQKIADILGVIDGIAFQTNILALNAAVEAARAGEQGRGFAVVASEVRNLAKRSADAAKDIKTLIGDSVERVTAGSQLVDHAGQVMQDIMGQVQSVATLITAITTSSQEQSSGIGAVNVAVSHLDQMTQQNAAMVEASTAAAHELQQQAARLVDAVEVFRQGA
jgi:aerotaxis receptor